MASEPQSAPTTKFPEPIECSCGFKGPRQHRHLDTIPEVLSTIEQRQFWERAYLEYVQTGYNRCEPEPYSTHCALVADEALKHWRERFAKAGE